MSYIYGSRSFSSEGDFAEFSRGCVGKADKSHVFYLNDLDFLKAKGVLCLMDLGVSFGDEVLRFNYWGNSFKIFQASKVNLDVRTKVMLDNGCCCYLRLGRCRVWFCVVSCRGRSVG